MGVQEKRQKDRERRVWADENKEFVTPYLLIASKQMTAKKIMKKLNLSKTEFNALENKYLQLYHGKSE